MNNKHQFSPLIRLSGLALLALLAAGASRVAAQGAGAVLPGGNPRAPVNINAPTLDYFDKEKKLVYSGGVVAKQGDSTLKASSLIILLNNTGSPTTQSETTSAASGGNQIRRIEASGPVTIVSKDQVGTGDNGAYDRAENKISLIGHVSLSQGGNVIKGGAESRLVYDLTTGRAQIVGGVNSLFTPGSGGDLPGKQSPKSSSKGGTP